MVYPCVFDPMRMLGFAPEKGTKANLEYGESLMRELPHGSVLQMQRWWQDPMTYHAFETKAGARWFGQHGGPTTFMNVVQEYLPEGKRERFRSPMKVEPKCYSCGESFGSLSKKAKYSVHRCTCGSKYTHTGCFMPKVCPICTVKINTLDYNTYLYKIIE